MNHLENLKSDAIEINLDETFKFLKDFAKSKTGIIESEIPTINGLNITFHKGPRGVIFETPPILYTVTPVKYQSINYGFTKSFNIIYNNQKLIVKDGIGKLKIKMGEGFSATGTLYELETSTFRNEGYFRAIFPIDGFTKIPLKYFLGQPFKIGESYRVAGLIQIEVNQKSLRIFDYEKEKQRFLFIDSKTKTSYEEFEKIIESVIYSFAFISGSLIRDEIMIIKSNTNLFGNIEDYQFRKVEDSIRSSLELVNPQEHRDYHNLKSKEYFPIPIFSNIVSECLNKSSFLRSIRIITQSRSQPIEIQIAATFVAMETVKELIIKKNIEEIRPFKNTLIASKLVSELKNIVSEIDEDEFNDKNSVIRKIENINSLGNNDSFKIAFKIVGLDLSRNDLKCISMRNRFLHGNSPHDNESEETRVKELTKIKLDAHLLTCALILKYSGYEGVIKNMRKYLDLINERNEISDDLFRTI